MSLNCLNPDEMKEYNHYLNEIEIYFELLETINIRNFYPTEIFESLSFCSIVCAVLNSRLLVMALSVYLLFYCKWISYGLFIAQCGITLGYTVAEFDVTKTCIALARIGTGTWAYETLFNPNLHSVGLVSWGLYVN